MVEVDSRVTGTGVDTGSRNKIRAEPRVTDKLGRRSPTTLTAPKQEGRLSINSHSTLGMVHSRLEEDILLRPFSSPHRDLLRRSIFKT